MSLATAMLRAKYARRTPRRIPIADFSKSVKIRIIRIKPATQIYNRKRPRSAYVTTHWRANPIEGLTPQTIMECVGRYYGIRVDKLISYEARKRLGRPRQIAMYLARMYTPVSSNQLGRYMSGRDHDTILRAQYLIERLLPEDEQLRAEIATLTEILKNTKEQANASVANHSAG